MTRRRRKPAEKVDRHRSNLFSSIGIECYTRLKPGRVLREQGMLVSKSFRKILPMFVVPFAGGLAITSVKLMQDPMSDVPAVILRRHCGTSEGK